MATHRTMSLVVAAVVVVLAAMIQNGGLVQSRSMNSLGRMEKFLTSLTAPVQDTRIAAGGNSLSPLRGGSLSFMPDHSVDKRGAYDSSCRGVYDRSLLNKLERVCEDCYNLYRKPEVEIGCKADCYANDVFRQCLTDLLLEDVLEEYAKAIQMVGK